MLFSRIFGAHCLSATNSSFVVIENDILRGAWKICGGEHVHVHGHTARRSPAPRPMSRHDPVLWRALCHACQHNAVNYVKYINDDKPAIRAIIHVRNCNALDKLDFVRRGRGRRAGDSCHLVAATAHIHPSVLTARAHVCVCLCVCNATTGVIASTINNSDDE